MKNTFKKMPLILYLCLFGLIFSCSPEQDILKSPQKNSRISQKPFKELLLLNSFNNAYEKVKTEKQKNLASRSALEDEYNFTVSEKHLVKIYEVDEKTYYNIFIKREAVDATYFENLLLINEKINGENVPTGYILKYKTPVKEAAVMIEQHEFFETTSTPLFGRTIIYCHVVCYPICCELGGGYTKPHVSNSSLCVTSYNLCVEVCQDYDVGGGSDSESGSGAEGGSSDGGGGGGSSSGGGNGSAPPPPDDCGTCNPPPPLILPVLPEDEDFGPPCPGDPIKSPTICPSSIGNIAGGTYGCTRNNPEKTCEGYIGKKKHGGLDIQGKVNDHVYNMHSGKVISFRNTFGNVEYKKDSLGNFVEIESVVNGQVVRIKYCHLANVPQYGIGQIINQGIIIGDIGRSGNAGDPNVKTHLHLQTKQKNGTIWQTSNPINYLNTTFNSNFMPLTTNCN